MSFQESEEHRIFRKTCHDFVEKEISPHVTQWENQGFVPRELFEKAGTAGFLGIRMKEEYGGQNLTFWFTKILVEELVKCKAVGICVSLMTHCEFASSIIEKYGNETLKKEFLADAIAGKKIGALGLTEPEAGSDLGHLQTKAARKNGKYIVSGQKTFITNGPICDFMTTAVRVGEGRSGIALLVIPSTSKGFQAKRLKKLGASSSATAEIFLDNVEVPENFLLGKEEEGFSYILNGFVGERLVLSIISYTQMENMLEEAVTYGKQRTAFGKPLLSHQVWRHRLADVRAAIEACRSLTEHAIHAFVEGKDAEKFACMSKLFCAEQVPPVAHTCAQIFGGYSFMEEYTMSRLLRDSTHFSVGAGTSEMMREMIAKRENW